MDELPAGHEIGVYKIIRVAGRGAVGVVYEAQHVPTGDRVAIKTLNRLFAGEKEFRARFDREAQGAAAVRHPHITSVHDSGEQDGLPYLVMTYVDGPDLDQILEQRGEALEPAEAVLICSAVAEALDAAAAQGLAHRDVKPANILLEGWGGAAGGGRRARPHVYLTDFGLTKHNAAATVTRTGQFVGTLLYMAPEQIEGKAVAASDQYSLACVLWECIEGRPPFLPSGGSNLSLLTAHLSDPIPSISERSNGRFSPRLDRVFRRAMAKKAEDRYESCIAFMEAAAEALGLGATTARPPAHDHPPGQDDTSSVAPGSTRVLTPEQLGRAGGRAAPSPSGTAPDPAPPPPLSPTPSAQPQGGPTGYVQPTGGGSRPPGMPPGLAPQAYTPIEQPGGSLRWVWIVLALLVVVGGVVAIILLTAGGDDSADAQPDDPAATPVATAVSTTSADDASADAPTDTGPATDTDTRPSSPAQGDPEGPPPASQGRIAFVAGGAVWAARADGAEVTRVIDLVAPVDGQPAWRPGTGELLVVRDGRLVLVDVADGAQRDLTDGPGHSDPAWYPDGQQVVFSLSDDAGGRDLAIVSLDGAITPLGLSGQIDSGEAASGLNRPAVSPLDESLAFQVNLADGLEIYRWTGDGPPAPVAGAPGANDFHPAFTPEGLLVYSTDRSGRDEIVRRLPDGSDETVVAASGGIRAKDADVSPCGNFVVFQVDGPQAGGSFIGLRELQAEGAEEPPRRLPLPEGVTSATDPGWTGQPCA